MDIIESIERYLVGSPTSKGERARLVRARDEIMRLRQAIEQAEKQEHEDEDEDEGLVGVFVEFTDGMLREVTDGSAGVSSYTAPQPQQEPVGKFAKFTDGIWREVTEGAAGIPLYTTPQPQPLIVQRAEEAFEAAKQREWQGLTDVEIGDLYRAGWATNKDFARAIEETLKERNT
jgi:hypothetical protein